VGQGLVQVKNYELLMRSLSFQLDFKGGILLLKLSIVKFFDLWERVQMMIDQLCVDIWRDAMLMGNASHWALCRLGSISDALAESNSSSGVAIGVQVRCYGGHHVKAKVLSFFLILHLLARRDIKIFLGVICFLAFRTIDLPGKGLSRG